jgi:hypothetical protein
LCMGVVVSSTISKSGSSISGNVPKIVVVRTNPGYEGNPGPSRHGGGRSRVLQIRCASQLEGHSPGNEIDALF